MEGWDLSPATPAMARPVWGTQPGVDEGLGGGVVEFLDRGQIAVVHSGMSDASEGVVTEERGGVGGGVGGHVGGGVGRAF